MLSKAQSSTGSDLSPTTNNDSAIDLLTGTNPRQALLQNSSSDLLIGNFSVGKTNSLGILEVTGSGVISVPTNTAEIQIGIEVEGTSASQVQQEIAQRSSTLINKLNELGVQKLQTVKISLDPKIQFEQGTRKVVGFIGRNILQFQIPTVQAGETIDAAINSGANSIENITFLAPESQLKQARLDALGLAVQDALAQAEAVLNPLNLTPVEIAKIDILSVSNPQAALPFDLRVASFQATTPILGGPQEVTANVALDISYI